jgi:hypothetical protein
MVQKNFHYKMQIVSNEVDYDQSMGVFNEEDRAILLCS